MNENLNVIQASHELWKKRQLCVQVKYTDKELLFWERAGTEWMYNQTAFRLIVTSSLAAYM